MAPLIWLTLGMVFICSGLALNLRAMRRRQQGSPNRRLMLVASASYLLGSAAAFGSSWLQLHRL
jgi:hypothetical protein